MQVPFLDLKPQYASVKQQVLSAVNQVLDSQLCIGGPKVEQLEKAIADYCGCKYAVGASSGTGGFWPSFFGLFAGFFPKNRLRCVDIFLPPVGFLFSRRNIPAGGIFKSLFLCQTYKRTTISSLPAFQA